jgi:hypothetical protein
MLRPRTAKGLSAIRCHHLVKTFWGWRDQLLPDGSPTGDLRPPEPTAPVDYCGERTAMMPTRRRTRRQDRAHRISAERQQNHHARTVRRSESMSRLGPAPPGSDDDPPPLDELSGPSQ